jgi:hypothetical protein
MNKLKNLGWLVAMGVGSGFLLGACAGDTRTRYAESERVSMGTVGGEIEAEPTAIGGGPRFEHERRLESDSDQFEWDADERDRDRDEDQRIRVRPSEIEFED